MKSCIGAIALVVCVLLASPSRGGEATIDGKVDVKFLMGNYYKVTYSGTLKLTDIGDNFEKWDAITCFVSQKGLPSVSMGISSLTKPTLTSDGSYTATGTVIINPLDKEWTASAVISYYKDNSGIPVQAKPAEKTFTVP